MPSSTPTAAPQAAAGVGADETIVVTGSLLRSRTGDATVSPVTVLSATALENAGITTVADAVRSVSADNSGSIPTAFSNGFATGASGVALRGLTVNSTLVLIDGLRTANYALADDGQRGFVDLNSIPDSLIDRVEILRDGASSTYGADAIGGVVNIILKKTFTGIEGNAEGGTSQHGGGDFYRFDLTAGKGEIDRNGYNAFINVEYQHDGAIRTRQRPFPFNTANLSGIGGANLDAGIPGLGGSIYAIVQPATLTQPGNILTGQPVPGAVFQVLNPRGCGARAQTVTDATGTYCEQNSAGQYGSIQPKQDRFGVTGRGTVRIADDIQGYALLSYYQEKTVVEGGPFSIRSTNPVITSNIALPALLPNGQINPNDPFAAAGNAALVQYAFGDIPQVSETFNHVIRGAAGINGSTGKWHFSADVTAAHTWLDVTNNGYINIPTLLADVTNGTYNFVDPTQNSPGVRAALSPAVAKTSTTDLDQIQLQANRPLFDLPGGPLQAAVGAAFRYEQTHDPDINPNRQTLSLGEVQTIGHHYVSSAFFELEAPIVKPIDINVSGRYDHYSEGFDRFSPKIGAKITPIREVVLRGTYSQGFRAPSFSESGNSGNTGFINYTPPTDFAAAHGNDAYVQNYSLALQTRSNPAIKPELSYSYTLGAVFQPLRWLSATVDYYNIRKTQVISGADPNAALNAYYSGSSLPAGYALILDNPDPLFPNAQRRIATVQAPYYNAASLRTSGLDFDITASINVSSDLKYTSDIDVTDILFFRFTPNGGDTQNYVGTQGPYVLSSGAGTPRIRGHWTNSLDYKDANLTATAYYVSGYRMTAADIGPSCLSTDSNGNPFPANCRTPSFIDVGLTASYKINSRYKIYLNVINLLDVKPPFNPANYAGLNYNPTYSQSGIVGRFFRVGVNAKF